MVNKIETLRSAKAVGEVHFSRETGRRLAENDLPKKDVLPTARAAALLAAKKTPEIIPDCHPLPLDFIEVSFTIEEEKVLVEAEAACIAKTGVEMEALTAVAAACLVIYDMLKPIEKSLEISGIHLVEKRGGKSDFTFRPPADFSCAVVITSDRSFEGKREDKTGPLIQEKLKSFGVEKIEYVLLPDDKGKIQETIRNLVVKEHRLILTSGGTGLSPRDVTVDAVRELLDREIPGVMEAARAFGQRRTPYAMLSRGVAGIIGECVVVTLPGSRSGVEECLAALFPALFHVYKPMAAGKKKASVPEGKAPCD